MNASERCVCVGYFRGTCMRLVTRVVTLGTEGYV